MNVRLCRPHRLVPFLTMLIGFPTVAVAQSGELVTEGSRVYGNTCGGCHNARSPLERTDAQWVTIINHMRVRANLTGRQTRAVLAFLQATNGNPAEETTLPGDSTRGPGAATPPRSDVVPTDPDLVAEGKALIAQKACIGCHVVASAGGNVGPALNGVVARRGAAFVRNKFADPTFNNATSMMPNFGLTDEQIEALVAYLATLNPGEPR